MSSKNEKAARVERKYTGEAFEIAVGEIERNKHQITLPLSYDFEFFPVDERGKVVPISSIAIRGTETIIKTPGTAAQWKLMVMKRADCSHLDPAGNTQTLDGGESGDIIDWLGGKVNTMDDNDRSYVQNARRKIIFQREGR